MAKAANTKLIGLFVLAGIALIVVTIVVFGGGRLFQPTRAIVMFFTASVQGLSVGSPLMFRGVPVGQVTDIDLFYDTVTLNFLTRVEANLFPENIHKIGEDATLPDKQFKRLIEAGLRAQLIPVSLVTGQLGVGLEMVPDAPAVLYSRTIVALRDGGAEEIPTVPSTIEQLQTTLQRVLAVVDKADFNQLNQDVQLTLQAIRELITMPELRQMIVQADATVGSASVTMKGIEQLVSKIDRDVGPALKSLRTAMDSADATMTDARTIIPQLKRDLAQVDPLLDKLGGALTIAELLLKNANATVEPGSPLQYEIANTLRELSLTMRAVRGLTDALEQSPNSILFGRKTETSK